MIIYLLFQDLLLKTIKKLKAKNKKNKKPKKDFTINMKMKYFQRMQKCNFHLRQHSKKFYQMVVKHI